MYFIYEIIGVKVGCTTDMVRRQKEQLSLGVMILLECYTDIEEASRRERELQVERGYPVDIKSYTTIRKTQVLATTPEARRKAVASMDYFNPETIAKRIANTDQKAKVANTDWKAKVANTDYAAIDQKGIQSHRQRGVVSISPEGIRTEYSGMKEASRQLTIKTGIKFVSNSISGVCNPKRPYYKTHRGYTFQYA